MGLLQEIEAFVRRPETPAEKTFRNMPPEIQEQVLDGRRSELERAKARYARGEIESAEMERQISAALLGWPILGHPANCDCDGCRLQGPHFASWDLPVPWR